MIKEFFKRTVIALTAIFMIAVYICAGAVSFYPRKAGGQTAYFLVEVTDSVGASAEMMVIRGGAGYIRATGSVAMNVYFSEKEAENALKNLLDEYPTAKIEPCVKYGGFDGEDGFLFSVVRTVEGWGQVLKEGVSQERIREGLSDVVAMLDYHFRLSGDERCREFLDEIESCLEGIITLGKVRYFLCFATELLWSGEKKEII